LINLLKVIFFHSSFSQRSTPSELRPIMSKILSSPQFIPIIVKGLTTPISYVRQQFISFISTCIPLLAQYLAHPALTTCVMQIMNNYFLVIKDLIYQQGEINSRLQTGKKPEDLVSSTRAADSPDTQRLQAAEEAVPRMQEESSNYEILAILEGVLVVLNFFLKIKTLRELEEEALRPPTFSLVVKMKTILSFGFYTPSYDNKNRNEQGKIIF